MSFGADVHSVEAVKSEIKKIGHNTQQDQATGPAINNLPAERGGGEDCFKKKKKHHA